MRIRLGGISGYEEKRKPGEIEILKILILTKPRSQSLTRIRLGGISVLRQKRKIGENEIPPIP